ncbi:hypothetical protein [Campylobacter corcagiensis]|uniref:Uncharacterized protein n=1 Tax=Campylobacter corcagiensis TaxID=1448857 RepID=A0A7M1LFV6_9BACT|nr:hypothetical protein [Campylobacter corcagiensis]QOQ87482.1 hypothetical protein IMC76_01285 [Campylobacter corcagiensis]
MSEFEKAIDEPLKLTKQKFKKYIKFYKFFIYSGYFLIFIFVYFPLIAFLKGSLELFYISIATFVIFLIIIFMPAMFIWGDKYEEYSLFFKENFIKAIILYIDNSFKYDPFEGISQDEFNKNTQLKREFLSSGKFDNWRKRWHSF